MPTYDYRCKDEVCKHEFDIIKPMADLDREEICVKCGKVAERFISRTHFYGASDWDKAEWNPAFGQVVRNGKHRKELAKRHGVVEVGNDFGSGDASADHFDRQRERKRQDAWEKV